MSLLRMLGLSKTAPDDADSPGSPIFQKIAATLAHFEPERAKYVAAFAYTLSRVAHADHDISEDETRVMKEILVESGALNAEEAEVVVEMTKEHTVLFGATEDFGVTQEFRRMSTKEERLSLIDCLFAVSAADHKISAHEEQMIRKISNELRLLHQDYISIRLRYRDHLSVFQSGSKESA